MSLAGEGITLSRSYFEEVVDPLLKQYVPDIRYAAARVGQGSDVLRLDDAESHDHDWGLRLQLFVADTDQAAVLHALDHHLPTDFRGYPVRFGFSADPTARMRVDVTSVTTWAQQHLGFDPRGGDVSVVDWLSLTGQSALEVVSGAVFEDQTGDLTGLREALVWYPDDLWRYVVACDWQRLDQEMPFMGRAGGRGDRLGSRTITARLVDIAIHLGFMLSRSWPPYSKWRGTLFAQLPGCEEIAKDLNRVLEAPQWHDRQTALSDALTGMAALQERVGLPAPALVVVPFWDRPYVCLSPSLVPALLETVSSADVQALPVGVGSVEQHTDNVDILANLDRRRALAMSVLAGSRGPAPTS